MILVGRQVDPASRRIPVRIELTNVGGLLRPGMTGTAWLPVGAATQAALTVPGAALQRLGERWVAFLPREKGAFEVRPVERGRTFGDRVEITTGLKPGETVVVEGAFLIKAEAEKTRGGAGDHHAH